MTNIFLKNNGIIKGSPSSHKASLVNTNDISQQRFQPGDYNLGDDFILSIVKTYVSKVFKESGISTFRDEAKVGGVDLRVYRVRSKGLFTKSNKVVQVYPKTFGIKKGACHLAQELYQA